MITMSYSKGLEGVIAGETAISNVEGDEGRLTYRGYPIEELVGEAYLNVAWLVCFGEFPLEKEEKLFREFMQQQGRLTKHERQLIATLPIDTHPMKVLQAIIPVMSLGMEASLGIKGMDKEVQRGMKIIAKIPWVLVAYYRRQSGQDLNSADSVFQSSVKDSKGYLQDFLIEFTQSELSEDHLQVLKLIQILQMEHSFNAGTFASMVVGSTLASIESVMAAGVGALSGELHGGADQAALEAVEKVGEAVNAGRFVKELLENKGKLMGMGHREYRVVDPRSAILKPVARKLCARGELSNCYQTLEAIETEFNQAMNAKGKDVRANLEFYKGVAMLAIGIPKDYFTAVFAMARSVGWLAHFIELRKDNRIYRPKALYTGKGLRSVNRGAS